MHAHPFARLFLPAALPVLALLTLLAVLAGTAREPRAETREPKILPKTATILDVSRRDQDSWVLVRTDHGDLFTQAGWNIPLKIGPGTLRLDGSGHLEALLLARVGARTTLLVCPDVDGLIVGMVLEDGTPVRDTITLERP